MASPSLTINPSPPNLWDPFQDASREVYFVQGRISVSALDASSDYKHWRWSRILSNLVDELRRLEHLQAQQDDDPIVAVAGQCLDLLASHPAIGTFIETLPELWYLTNYGLEDLVCALQAFIPKHKALQYPIMDTLPTKEHVLELSLKTDPSIGGLGDSELEYYFPADDYPASG
ncbi:hypothetical protein PHLCEN_2v12452 [Hermanssonia centrifuga]|uniref:Uncharacterized protein n=1 Tax=Hermanssonia centrifuga TaxID=98765 RepID=A0A2R6NH98_9APHY|nr:hypothetical protein PHLCEN_2v12452 [Hermanssonia centrifuga]